MKISYMALVAILFGLSGSAQVLNWQESKNWKIYDLRGRAALNARVDSLVSTKSSDLNLSELHSFLNDVSIWPEQKLTVWMGAYLATCEMADKKTRKVLISTYAGFFYDERTRRYYQVPSESVDEWLSFLNESVKKIAED